MTIISEKQAISLFEDYLSDRISESDASLLLEYLEENKAFSIRSLDNLFVDCLLQTSEAPPSADETEIRSYEADLKKLEFLRSLPSPKSPILRLPRNTSSKKEIFSRRSVCLEWIQKSMRTYGKRAVIGLFCLVFLVWGICGVYMQLFPKTHNRIAAHLTGFENLEWGATDVIGTLGDPIRSGWLKLDSGSISLKMLNGADLLLEGPAELRLISSSKIHLRQGYLSADVPPQAKYFIVETPHMNINVLGTSFWSKVTNQGSDVHLIEGRLKIDNPEIGSQHLTTGEAFSISQSGTSKLFQAFSEQFLLPRNLVHKTEKALEQQEENLLSGIGSDPSLLVFFNFRKFGRTIPNLARQGQVSIPEGKLYGCIRVKGENPYDGAIGFRQNSDHLQIEIPRTFMSLTFACRLKIDSEVVSRQSILMSDDFEKGAVQWMIGQGGIPVLKIGGGKSASRNFNASAVFTAANLGQWRRLAVTLDAVAGKATWYLEGTEIGSFDYENATPIHIGKAMIGHWKKYSGNDQTSFDLAGLMIFDRALSEEEIRDLKDL